MTTVRFRKGDRVKNLRKFEEGIFQGIDEATGYAKVDYLNGTHELARLQDLVKII